MLSVLKTDKFPLLGLRVAVYWPEPEEFKPERFIDTDEYKWDRDSFMPFSAGARACIGRKFSEVEMVGASLYRFHLLLSPSECHCS